LWKQPCSHILGKINQFKCVSFKHVNIETIQTFCLHDIYNFQGSESRSSECQGLLNVKVKLDSVWT